MNTDEKKKEDDLIKDIFNQFSPQLNSDDLFMMKLMRNLDAVDEVKKQNEELKKKNWRIGVISAMTGFISGVVLTSFFPFIFSFLKNLFINLTPFYYDVDFMSEISCWVVICGISIFVSLFSFNTLNEMKIR